MGWEKIKHYFQHGLWDFSLYEKKGWSLFYYKTMRITSLAIRGFIQDKCSLRASALTYYTMISFVPILAMAFAVASGFGLKEYLKTQLLENFPENQAIFLSLFSFSDRLLEQTQGEILAGVGILLLIWSVTQLLSNMESALNHIWGVRKLRSWRRLFSDYFAFMLIGPLFYLFANALAVLIAHYIQVGILDVSKGSFFTTAILYAVTLIPYAMFWVLFSFIYLFLPNTKVQTRSAFIGGIVAGTLYLILQWAYIHFQVGVTRYGAIYGSLAALPLFLVWIQMSWFLLLFGAQISFAHQTHEQREYEPAVEQMSYSFRLLLALWIVQICIERFTSRQSPLSVELLMRKYQIPYSIATLLIHQLIDANIFIEVKENNDLTQGYLPKRDINQLRISDVIDALQNTGSRELPPLTSKAFEQLEGALQSFRQKMEQSEQNRFLKDL